MGQGTTVPYTTGQCDLNLSLKNWLQAKNSQMSPTAVAKVC